MVAPRSPQAAGLLLVAALCIPAASPAIAAEGVGEELGYRLYGEARKNKPLLLQNSRPTPVEVFDDARGVFIAIDRYSDLEYPCRGKERLLKLRFRDSFRESVPFQVRIACGRELQFISPAHMAAPRVAPVAEPNAEPVAAAELPSGPEPAVPGAPAGDQPPGLVTDTDPAASAAEAGESVATP